MFREPIRLSLGFATAFLSCAASSSWAAPTVCDIDPSIPGIDTTIAVASNFFGPAKALIADFTAPGAPGDGTLIRICQNATGQLDREIRGTGGDAPPGVIGHYSFFLAANTATPIALQGTSFVPSGATEFLYARGIPTLFSIRSAITKVGDLVPSLGSTPAKTATISTTVTSSQALSTANAQTLAVASYTDAPYGLAAVKILKDMGQWNYVTNPTPIPSWVHNPLYANIDLTLQGATTGTDKSAFVSKAQVCDLVSTNPTIVYVAFTGYLIDQGAILIDSGDSTQNTLATSLKNFITTNSNPSYWSGFLSAQCYAPI